MASLNLAGKTSGYVKLTAPDDSSTNPTVTLPTESGELALKSDIGEGGGGPTPTPEDLVWENKVDEREYNKEYTNPYDVPIYVDFYSKCEDSEYYEIYIAGKWHGTIGNETSGSTTFDKTQLIVPAKATYKINATNPNGASKQWWEAKMPLAIAVGDASGGGSGPSVDTAIGMVAPFAMDSVPTGWLHCDGSAVSRDTYSLLYSKVADLYGAGDGSTTFNLPNLQDEFIRGSSDTLPVGNKQDDEFKEHRHLWGGNDGQSPSANTGGPNFGDAVTFTAYAGGSETRPRNIAMLYCINATAEPSSGGGDYTPEKMVWEDVTADRVLDTVYTNSNEVPLYVQLYVESPSTNDDVTFYIDGKFIGRIGKGGGTSDIHDTSLFIVPAGSTYELKAQLNGTLKVWHEARMPVAVGTGGDSIWTEEGYVAEYDGKGMVVRVDGDVAMEVTNSKKSKFYGEVQIPTLPTNGNPSNIYVNESGVLYKSTATTYTSEEVDKKLAIKDKLIEKLSERLDALEKKLKK